MKLFSKIDTKNSIVDLQTLIDIAHPVGSYYWSSDSTSPNELFNGGVTTNWTQITDRFILAAGSTYRVGNTGGEAAHTLTTSEMPSHSHSAVNGDTSIHFTQIDIVDGTSGKVSIGSSGTINRVAYGASVAGGWQYLRDDDTTATTGGSSAHNNMPPYIVAYCWRRIS